MIFGKSSRILWLSVGLLLLFFFTRLVSIQTFPPFLDELQHVQEAELTFHSNPFTFVGEGRLFSIWWFMLFQPHQAATVWLMRTCVLLVVLAGFAAIVKLGALAGGNWGALSAGLVYLFSTYQMFFERLALADPIYCVYSGPLSHCGLTNAPFRAIT